MDVEPRTDETAPETGDSDTEPGRAAGVAGVAGVAGAQDRAGQRGDGVVPESRGAQPGAVREAHGGKPRNENELPAVPVGVTGQIYEADDVSPAAERLVEPRGAAGEFAAVQERDRTGAGVAETVRRSAAAGGPARTSAGAAGTEAHAAQGDEPGSKGETAEQPESTGTGAAQANRLAAHGDEQGRSSGETTDVPTPTATGTTHPNAHAARGDQPSGEAAEEPTGAGAAAAKGLAAEEDGSDGEAAEEPVPMGAGVERLDVGEGESAGAGGESTEGEVGGAAFEPAVGGELVPVLWSEASPRRRILSDVPHWPVVTGRLHLALAVVLHTRLGAASVHYLTYEQIGEHSFDVLMAEACDELTERLTVDVEETPDGDLFSLSGTLVAAAVCVPDFYRMLAEFAAAERLLVGIVSPNLVYVAPDGEFDDMIARLVLDSEHDDTELVPCVVRVTGDGVEFVSERPTSLS